MPGMAVEDSSGVVVLAEMSTAEDPSPDVDELVSWLEVAELFSLIR